MRKIKKIKYDFQKDITTYQVDDKRVAVSRELIEMTLPLKLFKRTKTTEYKIQWKPEHEDDFCSICDKQYAHKCRRLKTSGIGRPFKTLKTVKEYLDYFYENF